MNSHGPCAAKNGQMEVDKTRSTRHEMTGLGPLRLSPPRSMARESTQCRYAHAFMRMPDVDHLVP